jgi:hypothetical protein
MVPQLALIINSILQLFLREKVRKFVIFHAPNSTDCDELSVSYIGSAMGFSSINSICYLHKYAPQGVLEHPDQRSALKARKFVIFQWYIPQTLFSLHANCYYERHG